VAEANASAEEAIAGVRVVQSFTAEPLEKKRYSDQVWASYRVALRRAVFRAVFVAGIVLAMFSAISVVLWYGGRLVIVRSLSPGNLVTFLLYTLFAAGAVGTLTGLYSQFQEALGATRRIFELLDETSDLAEPVNPVIPHPKGEVRFEAVSFRYGDRGNANVLTGVSLLARHGEVIALVGPSNAPLPSFMTPWPSFSLPSQTACADRTVMVVLPLV